MGTYLAGIVPAVTLAMLLELAVEWVVDAQAQSMLPVTVAVFRATPEMNGCITKVLAPDVNCDIPPVPVA